MCVSMSVASCTGTLTVHDPINSGQRREGGRRMKERVPGIICSDIFCENLGNAGFAMSQNNLEENHRL